MRAGRCVVYEFGAFELDVKQWELRAQGRALPLQPKQFAVLAVLVEHSDRVVSRDELAQKVWPGESVTPSSLTFCIAAIRKALSDGGGDANWIRVYRGRGYRFVGEVRTPSSRLAPLRTSTTERPKMAPPDGSFIGREQELAALVATSGDVLAGRARTILLSGEAGIGKTRTVEEFTRQARSVGFEVLTARCDSGNVAPAFWTWMQILRSYCQRCPTPRLHNELGPGAADIARLVPDLSEGLETPELPADLDTAQSQLRLFDSIAGFLTNAARTQPLLLFFDDLHSADRSSLLLLRFVIEQCTQARLMVVGTYRDFEVEHDHPLALIHAALQRKQLCDTLPLRGLSDDSVARLITSTIGTDIAASLVESLAERGGGNPFFVIELCRHLLDEGVVTPTNREWTSERSLDGGVPASIRDLLQRRLRNLSVDTQSLLRAAAVIGPRFEFRLAQAVSRLTQESAFDALEDALAAHALKEVPQRAGCFRFAHGLIHEVIYDGLLTVRRVELHGTIARALQQTAGADDDHLDELAYHLIRAASPGNTASAVEYSRRAGHRALARFADDEAAKHFERALAVLDLDTDTDANRLQRCELLLDQGRALARTGAVMESRRPLAEAAELARQLGSPEHLAQAALETNWRRPRPHFESVAPTELLLEALDRLGDSQPGMRAQLLARTAIGLARVGGTYEQRVAYVDTALDLTRAANDSHALRQVLMDAMLATWHPDRFEINRRLAEELLQSALRDRAMAAALFADGWCVAFQLEAGDFEELDRTLAAARQRADDTRHLTFRWGSTFQNACRARLCGRLDEAQDLAQTALELGTRANEQHAALACWGAQTFVLYRDLGRLAEVEPQVDAFAQASATDSLWRWLPPFIDVEEGRHEEARLKFEQLAGRSFADLPRADIMDGGYGWIATTALLSEVCAALGDRPRAAHLYQALLPYAERWVIIGVGIGCLGSVKRYLGLLASTLGLWVEATDHFERAVIAHHGAPTELARTNLDYATMLLQRRPRAHGVEQARRLLAAADAAAAQYGLTTVARRVQQLRTQHRL